MKSLVFVFITLFSSLALASNSQFFFQADKGEAVFTPGAGFAFSETETSVNGAKGTSKSVGVTVRGSFEYGFSDNWSVGGALGYSNSDLSSSSTFGSEDSVLSGITDPNIFVKSYSQFSNVTLWYGGSFSFSLEDNKPSNQASGRKDVALYVGADALIAKKHRVGGRLSQGFLLGDQEIFDEQGNSTKYSGANSTRLDAYYEYNYNNGLVGANVFYSYTSDRKDERTGNKTPIVSFFGYQFFANFQMSESWTLIPDLSIATTLESESNGVEIEKYIIFASGVSARYTF